MTKKVLISLVKIKERPKGLHNFTFYNLIFAFSFQPLISNIIVGKYLHLYICRDSFTDVMSALQIHLFLQNKAKFQKVKSNVNIVLTKDYGQLDTWSIRKNKPKTKPIQSQFKPNLSCRSLLAKQEQTQFQTKNAEFKNRYPAGCRPIQCKTFNKPVFSIVFWYSNVYILYFQLHCKQRK